jgi:hypothetical protein
VLSHLRTAKTARRRESKLRRVHRQLTVIGVVFVEISVSVSRVDSSVSPQVHEGVEQMSDLSSREIGRLVVAVIDTPIAHELAKVRSIERQKVETVSYQLVK